jgi:hypothetical protein
VKPINSISTSTTSIEVMLLVNGMPKNRNLGASTSAGSENGSKPTPMPALGSPKKGSQTQKMAVTSTITPNMMKPRLVALIFASLMWRNTDG